MSLLLILCNYEEEPTPPSSSSFLLLETADFLLQENGDKIVLE